MAAAGSKTLQKLRLHYIFKLPVQPLAAFCRNNRNVKILDIENCDFTYQQELELQGGPSSEYVLDTLVLWFINFLGRQAALYFANLVQTLKQTDLVLGFLSVFVDEQDEEDELVNRILSGLLKPSVKRLNYVAVLQECNAM